MNLRHRIARVASQLSGLHPGGDARLAEAFGCLSRATLRDLQAVTSDDTVDAARAAAIIRRDVQPGMPHADYLLTLADNLNAIAEKDH